MMNRYTVFSSLLWVCARGEGRSVVLRGAPGLAGNQVITRYCCMGIQVSLEWC